MDVYLEASTEVTHSRTKLFIQTRLPVIEAEGTSSARSQNGVELTNGDQSAADDVVVEPERARRDAKWAYSDGQRIRHNPPGSQDSTDPVLPTIIRHNYVRSAPTADRKCAPDDAGISVRGAGRHMSTADRTINDRQSRDLVRTPLYRIKTSSSRISISAHAHSGKPPRANRSVAEESKRTSVAPIKQTYFIIEKPGVKVHYSRVPIRRKESNRQNPERTKYSAPPSATTPDVDLLTITFRDADSPTFDSKRAYSTSGRTNTHVLLTSDDKLRLRSASIPTMASIGDCVTGTSKMLHSRSEDRIT